MAPKRSLRPMHPRELAWQQSPRHARRASNDVHHGIERIRPASAPQAPTPVSELRYTDAAVCLSGEPRCHSCQRNVLCTYTDGFGSWEHAAKSYIETLEKRCSGLESKLAQVKDIVGDVRSFKCAKSLTVSCLSKRACKTNTLRKCGYRPGWLSDWIVGLTHGSSTPESSFKNANEVQTNTKWWLSDIDEHHTFASGPWGHCAPDPSDCTGWLNAAVPDWYEKTPEPEEQRVPRYKQPAPSTASPLKELVSQDLTDLAQSCFAYLAPRFSFLPWDTFQQLDNAPWNVGTGRSGVSTCVRNAPRLTQPENVAPYVRALLAEDAGVHVWGHDDAAHFFRWIVYFLGLRCTSSEKRMAQDARAWAFWDRAMAYLPGVLKLRSVATIQALLLLTLSMAPECRSPYSGTLIQLAMQLAKQLKLDERLRRYPATRRHVRPNEEELGSCVFCSCVTVERITAYRNGQKAFVADTSVYEACAGACSATDWVFPTASCSVQRQLRQEAHRTRTHVAPILQIEQELQQLSMRKSFCGAGRMPVEQVHILHERLNTIQRALFSGISSGKLCGDMFCQVLEQETHKTQSCLGNMCRELVGSLYALLHPVPSDPAPPQDEATIPETQGMIAAANTMHAASRSSPLKSQQQSSYASAGSSMADLDACLSPRLARLELHEEASQEELDLLNTVTASLWGHPDDEVPSWNPRPLTSPRASQPSSLTPRMPSE